MSLQVENIVNIGTIKKQVQKLNTSGDFIPGSVPVFTNTLNTTEPFKIDLTASGGHLFFWNGISGKAFWLHDVTQGVDVLIFNGSDWQLYSTTLGSINITTLRSDVNASINDLIRATLGISNRASIYKYELLSNGTVLSDTLTNSSYLYDDDDSNIASGNGAIVIDLGAIIPKVAIKSVLSQKISETDSTYTGTGSANLDIDVSEDNVTWVAISDIDNSAISIGPLSYWSQSNNIQIEATNVRYVRLTATWSFTTDGTYTTSMLYTRLEVYKEQ